MMMMLLFICLCVDALHPSHQIVSHVGMIPCLPGTDDDGEYDDGDYSDDDHHHLPRHRRRHHHRHVLISVSFICCSTQSFLFLHTG